jgi:hypothetical protein
LRQVNYRLPQKKPQCSACIDLNDRPGFLLLAMPADIVGIGVPDSDVPVAAMALGQRNSS